MVMMWRENSKAREILSRFFLMAFVWGAIASTTAFAQIWTRVTGDDLGNTFIDRESKRTARNGNVIVWQWQIHSAEGIKAHRKFMASRGISSSTPTVYSTKTQIEFSPDRKSKVLFMVLCGNEDEVIGHQAVSQPFTPILPGTIMETVWKHLYSE